MHVLVILGICIVGFGGDVNIGILPREIIRQKIIPDHDESVVGEVQLSQLSKGLAF